MITSTASRQQARVEEKIDGLDSTIKSWGDYLVDDLLIRKGNRTIHEVIRRIDKSSYVMDPDGAG
ncbi:MAG: hypothetical protein OXC68_03690 [Aestuariivita sp.]|nr:hypothetical protein [Aestuariivita sp.]